MLSNSQRSPNVVMLGLADVLAAELGKVLSEQARAVYAERFSSASHCLGLIDRVQADLVFCSAEPQCYAPLVQAIQEKRPGLPIVVVSRRGEVSEWLNALEAGVSDYCAPPFESIQVRWILEGALKSWALKSQVAAA
jgi:DNA-binding NtrC family response regulator